MLFVTVLETIVLGRDKRRLQVEGDKVAFNAQGRTNPYISCMSNIVGFHCSYMIARRE